MSKKYPLLDNEEWLRKRYQEEKLSAKEIGKQVGCSKCPVLDALKHFNIAIRTNSEAHKGKGGEKHPWYGRHHTEETKRKLSKKARKYFVLEDKDWLYQKYWIEGFFTTEIAKTIGCATSTVCAAFKHHNIPLRDISEVRSGKGNPNYGKSLSEKHREKIAKARRGKYAGENCYWFGKHLSEGHKQKIRKSRKEQYKNPEFAKKMFKAHIKKPTKPEKVFQEIINNNNLPFKYVGDGEKVIGNKCPDFVHLTEKIVIEIFGRAYHSPLYTFKKTMHYHQTYKGTIKHYKKHGYKCFILWDTDLERKDAEQFVLSVLRREKIIS